MYKYWIVILYLCMSCQQSCYQATIRTCADIVIKCGLTPGAEVYWIIKRSGSNVSYQRRTAVQPDGSVVINESLLPDWFLSVPGSYYWIQLREADDYLQTIPMIFNGEAYECIDAKIIDIDIEDGDTSPTNVIQ